MEANESAQDELIHMEEKNTQDTAPTFKGARKGEGGEGGAGGRGGGGSAKEAERPSTSTGEWFAKVA